MKNMNILVCCLVYSNIKYIVFILLCFPISVGHLLSIISVFLNIELWIISMFYNLY
jgi:hypothetical protein